MDDFELLESIRCEDGEFLWLDRHLDRLATSAAFFGFPFDQASLTKTLDPLREAGPVKVRLTLSRDGDGVASVAPIGPMDEVRLAVDETGVDPAEVFLHHKTTNRRVYDSALAAHPQADDVALTNYRGELTEATNSSIIIRFGDRWVTPPVGCGLLPGIHRAVLLESGKVEEQRLTIDDLRAADEISLVNSVRLRRRATLVCD